MQSHIHAKCKQLAQTRFLCSFGSNILGKVSSTARHAVLLIARFSLNLCLHNLSDFMHEIKFCSLLSPSILLENAHCVQVTVLISNVQW